MREESDCNAYQKGTQQLSIPYLTNSFIPSAFDKLVDKCSKSFHSFLREDEPRIMMN